jgi:hypothetical protein
VTASDLDAAAKLCWNHPLVSRGGVEIGELTRLIRMRLAPHVRFLGGIGGATRRSYPASKNASGNFGDVGV